MSHSKQTVRLAAGVRDFLPRAAARRRSIADALAVVFESWGYERIITPVVEVADVLDRGLGSGARAQAIRFVEPMTGEVVALRPDITPQIARIAATRLESRAFPVRLCYEGAVTRLSNRAGGQRELLQAGIELFDCPSPDGDAEALAVASAALAATRLRDFRLDLGHVAFSRFALRHCEAGQRKALEVALARKDRSGVAKLADGMRPATARIVRALPTLFGTQSEVLSRARDLRLPKELSAAVDELAAVLDLSRGQVPNEVHERITLDFGEVRGWDYYTGLRFRGFATGVGHAVLRGGRYDELVGSYGRDAVATGFAIDVEGVAESQDAIGIADPPPSPGLVIAVPRAQRVRAQRAAASMRSRGHRVLVQVLESGRGVEDASNFATAAGWTHLITWSRAWRGASLRARSSAVENLDRQLASAAEGRSGPLERWLLKGE